MSDTNSFGYGQMAPEDLVTEGTTISFIARQFIAQLNVMKLVQVKAVHPGSGTPPAAGTVDVQPLVSQIDANGYATPHGLVYGIPYWRLQAGGWAIIADPVAGDVGYVICGDRDGSNVTRQSSGSISGTYTPGTRRQYDLADGIYMGGCLNGAPTQYLQLKSDGTLKIADGDGNVLVTSSSGFTVTTASGGDFVVNGISVTKHTHAVTAAPGETGTPVG
jgi:hypothetical protein